jgi:hypothetical protein
MFGDNFTYTTTPYFTDVPATNIYFPFIQKLRDAGVTNGCSATSFCPNEAVSRGDAAVLIVRGKMAGLFGANYPYPTAPSFADVPATSYMFPAVQKMFELGITSGCAPNSFCPTATLTRQEMAVFITRAFLN